MKLLLILVMIGCSLQAQGWGFYGHRKINYYAAFLLPPSMLSFYKEHLAFLEAHAVDPDKRRYALAEEGPRHYIDLDRYGAYPFDSLPRSWDAAVARFSADSLQAGGIVPWWVDLVRLHLTRAFAAGDAARILKLSAEIGHYIADAHVPLHAHSNHNGQYTNQRGIHGFWESRVPELLAEKEWQFFIGRAGYLPHPLAFIWDRVLESAAAADSVLRLERELASRFPADQKWAFEERNGKLARQYSSAFTVAYNRLLNGMVERRMRQSVYAVASFWYTAWVDAGQPDLTRLRGQPFSAEDKKEFAALDAAWRSGKWKGREE